MSVPIRVLIRADAGRALGTGHFARASSVAAALGRGVETEVVLATQADAAGLIPAYFPGGVEALLLPPDAAQAGDTMAALDARGWRPDAIYLDHYGEVAAWEAEARRRGVSLLVFDDLDAASSAEVIVRPHGGGTVSDASILLSGPAWLPLSQYVSERGVNRTAATADRVRLNVCFGGTDPTGETAKAIAALAHLPQIDADIVVGPSAAIDPQALAVAEKLPHLTVHRAPSQAELARLMGEADLALGAGGVMLWERLCLGLPSLVIAAADNQRPQIDRMVEEGAIRFLGDHAGVTAHDIRTEVGELAVDTASRAEISRRGRQLVDGRGALRIAAWLRAMALTARDVTAADGPALLEWRTDESNWQHNWDGAEKPTLDRHMAWLNGRLGDPDCVFRIITRGDRPAGVVRFDLSDHGRSAYLSIYLVPGWRGQRLGLPVFFAAERALRQSHPRVERIVSRIHQANAASVQLHRDAAFEFAQSTERADWFDAVKSLA